MIMTNSLQEGISYDTGSQPGKFFGLLFLRANHKFDSKRIGSDLARIWHMHQNLKNGNIRDLGHHTVPTGNLKLLVGYGLRCFKIGKLPLQPPEEFSEYGSFSTPVAGEPILTGSGLKYD